MEAILIPLLEENKQQFKWNMQKAFQQGASN